MPTRPDELPAKLFFRIGEVAGLVGVEPHVLRYWEREFRSIRPTKSAKGQRVYSRKDVENLLRVRDLLYRDGFTIAGARKKLQRPGDAPESETSVALARAPETEAEPEAASEDELRQELEEAPVRSGQQTTAKNTTKIDEQQVRQKLAALRSEVAEFLAELSRR